MKIYNILSVICLVVLVLALPIYARWEPMRMDLAQARLRDQFVADAAVLYLETCASCHGLDGNGLGAMPALNGPGLVAADSRMLFNTIAHSPHGSAMASWHVEEGGILNTYEVQGLVTLIREADWHSVSDLASSRAFSFAPPSVSEADITALEGVGEDPHECRACHEEPAMHADRFGLNCARCHGLEAWKPALLTRHTFLLDHGGQGKVACETCHTTTYSAHTCYGCHDHTPEQMESTHVDLDIYELANCAECHPTGQEGEAIQWQASATPPLPRDGYRIGDQH